MNEGGMQYMGKEKNPSSKTKVTDRAGVKDRTMFLRKWPL